ncbi:hypothetical protein TNCV_1964161 [Trichonephila clavipes]|nr:hypothetical protein TNCV_1964161 [Trichonephila clavipes]
MVSLSKRATDTAHLFQLLSILLSHITRGLATHVRRWPTIVRRNANCTLCLGLTFRFIVHSYGFRHVSTMVVDNGGGRQGCCVLVHILSDQKSKRRERIPLGRFKQTDGKGNSGPATPAREVAKAASDFLLYYFGGSWTSRDTGESANPTTIQNIW